MQSMQGETGGAASENMRVHIPSSPCRPSFGGGAAVLMISAFLEFSANLSQFPCRARHAIPLRSPVVRRAAKLSTTEMLEVYYELCINAQH